MASEVDPAPDVVVGLNSDLVPRIALRTLFRHAGWILLLAGMGWLDYVTGRELADSPFYILVLLPISLLESWVVCLAYSILAAVIFLGVDLVSMSGTDSLIYSSWGAFARLISFALVSITMCRLLAGRRRLQHSEQRLREKSNELEAQNGKLEVTLGEVKRLQGDLVAEERRLAVAEAISDAAYQIERPLVSASVYVEELRRLLPRIEAGQDPHLVMDEMQPLLEKLGERTAAMDQTLEEIRKLRKQGHKREPLAS
jgi:hypothetical protein